MPDTLRYVREERNVVTLRTFSKIHGLASVRVGYGIARPELIEVMHKTRAALQRQRDRRRSAHWRRWRMKSISAKRKRLTDEGRSLFRKRICAR